MSDALEIRLANARAALEEKEWLGVASRETRGNG